MSYVLSEVHAGKFCLNRKFGSEEQPHQGATKEDAEMLLIMCLGAIGFLRRLGYRQRSLL